MILPIIDIADNIKVCVKGNALTGALILTYCAIDIMAFLSMPSNQIEVRRDDFIKWVDKYMKTDPKQPYQYQGTDLYGARCGILHNYGVESNLSRSGGCRKIAYSTKSKHSYDSIRHPDLIILGIRLFIGDFYDAVCRFLSDIEKDESLKCRVETRLPNLFVVKYV